jgi:hypothetical protein
MFRKVRNVTPKFLPIKKANFDEEVTEVENTLPSLNNSSNTEEIFSDLLIVFGIINILLSPTTYSLLFSATNCVKPDFTKGKIKEVQFLPL